LRTGDNKTRINTKIKKMEIAKQIIDFFHRSVNDTPLPKLLSELEDRFGEYLILDPADLTEDLTERSQL
jgi:hypothetical protein